MTLPNIVIVKFDGKLVSFPMTNEGMINQGQEFESDYELEDHNIIFSFYDDDTQTSTEIRRFSYVDNDGNEKNVKDLYDSSKLQGFVKHIFDKEDFGDI